MKKFTAYALILLLLSAPAASAQPQRFDVLITEIMADPAPQVGLPNAEYLEIRNRSAQPILLTGWKLSDANSTATISANIFLQPDSFLILCSTGNATALAGFGRTYGLSGFPSLDNDGELLTLRAPNGMVIHALAYSAGWYGNALKAEGGWSLEMVDPANPCGGAGNWKACTAGTGGTPGKINSVNGTNHDNDAPQLVRTYSLDSMSLLVLFSEPLDSFSAAQNGNYSLSDGQQVISATPLTSLFDQVRLKLSAPMEKRKVYQLSVSHIKDCSGQTSGTFSTKAGWSEPALQNDIVINELLFNPAPSGVDYVELFNRSGKILDASQLFIGNRNATGSPGSLKQLSTLPFAIYPGDHAVVTENKGALSSAYFTRSPELVLELSLPSFPDDKGTVLLLDHQGRTLDELNYDAGWHFALLAQTEGVSLERIDPDDPTQQQDNWHSAASTSGFGTPTARNSQYLQRDHGSSAITIQPGVFSPDNDGRDDFTAIGYVMSEPGYVATVIIFDAGGRPVRHLARNALLGLKGSWKWDGLDEDAQRLPAGVYVIFAEIFNLQGKKRSFKNSVVLARSF